MRAEYGGAIIQDQIDCAEAAAAAGFHEEAAVLAGAIVLQLGPSRARSVLSACATARSGLWGERAGPSVAAASSGFALDLAVSDLTDLLDRYPVVAWPVTSYEHVLPPDGLVPSLKPSRAEDVAHLRVGVEPFLRNVPFIEGAVIGEGLQALTQELLAVEPISLTEHLDQPTASLVTLFALARTQHFVRTNQDLLEATASTPDLFAHAARLEPGGLGAYFTNVRMIIRSVRDIFALIEAAHGGPASKDVTAFWAVLLSASLTAEQTLSLIDELGDRGMTGALRRFLLRVARNVTAPRWQVTAKRIRDVGIDIGDFALAADAQETNARLARSDANEWKILAEIRRAQAHSVQAQAAYDRALFWAPGKPDILESIAGFRAGREIALTHGYETPPGRARIRQAKKHFFDEADRTRNSAA